MPTQISPMLAVTDGQAAIDFYQAAFGAEIQCTSAMTTLSLD